MKLSIMKSRAWMLVVLGVVAALVVALPSAWAAQAKTGLVAGTMGSKAAAADEAEDEQEDIEEPAKQAYKKATTKLDVDKSTGWVIADGTYYIAPYANSNLALGSKGRKVVLQNKSTSSAQKWKLKFDYDSQTYTIVNVKTGKALTAAGKAKKGSKVYLSKMVKKNQRLTRYATRNIAIPTQRWCLTTTANGYRFVSAANKNVMIDIKSGAPKLGKKSAAKRGRFWLVGARGTYAKNGIASGAYVMASGVNGKLLNITKSSIRDKARARVGSALTNWGQIFEFKYAGNGYYKIFNYNSGKVLTASKVSNKVIQYFEKKKDTANQLWKPVIVGENGAVQLISKKTGKALSTNGRTTAMVTAADAKVETVPDSQRWVLSPTTTGLTDTGKKALYRINKLTSKTKWCIAVDMGVHQFFLFEKAKSSQKGAPWVLNDTCRCTTGRNKCTWAGTTTTGSMPGSHPTINAKWCIYVNHGSYLHSILFGGGGNEQLGWNISHGCIRIPFSNAEHVFKTIKRGTKMIRWYK